MKILHYTLRGYSPFSYSKIKELSLDYPENIQVILGNNGCGKSSYLRTLTPYPLSRSVFKESSTPGYREMVLEHDGHVYTLISDYSNKTSPHQFIKDSEGNLNDGGTTNVQCELIETHLGLSREKENLLFGKIPFCSMKPGEVKPFLMKICPLDLGWILDLQKKNSSLLRNIKAELKYLTARETQLLSEMITDDELSLLKEDKVKLHKTITKLIGDKSSLKTKVETLEENISKLYKQSNDISSLGKVGLEQQLNKTEDSLKANSDYELLLLSSSIPPEDYSKHEYEKESLENSISDIVLKLDEIDSSLKKSESENVAELTAIITSDKARADELKSFIIDNNLSYEEIESIENVYSPLQDVLSYISKVNGGKRIWTRKHLRKKEDIFRRITNRMSNHQLRAASLEKEISGIEKDLNSGWSPAVSPCAEGKCLLYILATSKLNERKESLKLLKLDLSRDLKFINRYSDYIVARANDLKERSEVELALGKLRDLALRDCPPLLRFFKRSDLLEILASNPYSLMTDIKDFVNSSIKTIEYNRLIRDIETNETKLNAMDKISESYKTYLKDNKSKLEKELESLNTRYKICSDICKSIKHKLEIKEQESLIEKYKEDISKITLLEGEINELNSKKELLSIEKYKIEEELSSSMSKLTEIEMTLNSQEKIHSRYNDEVKSRKEDLELKQKHYTDLEYAEIELSKNYMRKWMEDLVAQVNVFINVVWNQPLELVLPADDKDYKFTVKFKGREVSNLNLCSSAMEDIIDLCFCLALRSPVASIDGVGMRGYPLILDETGRTFDDAHKSNLIDLFNLLTQEGLVSQIYLASHHAVIHGGLTNIQTLVLNPDNIALPAEYNQSVDITYY